MIKLIRSKFLLLVILSQSVAIISLKEAIATEFRETNKCSQLFSSNREEISRLVKESEFIKKYENQRGYLALAQELNMQLKYLYREVSSHLTKTEMKQLGWQAFQGRVEEFNSLTKYLWMTITT